MNGYRQLSRTTLLGAAIGFGACAACLLLGVVDAHAALAGWLVGFAFWSALPLGCLVLLMMMRLIPGRWTEELAGPAEAALFLLPATLVAVLPVLGGLDRLYPWVGREQHTPFRQVYLSPWFFSLRTLALLAGSMLLAFLLIMRPRWSVPVASAGLIAFVLLNSAVSVDWLMSLDPGFHSSGFGLYVLSVQCAIALSLLVLMRAAAPGDLRDGTVGALLLTALLLWAYFAFMQYVIIWSGNLPQGAAWYILRGSGGWAAVEYALAGLQLAPAFLLGFPPVRRSRAWLVACASAVLAGKALEVSWLVLPATGSGAVAVVAAVLALCGLGVLAVGGLVLVQRSRMKPANMGAVP